MQELYNTCPEFKEYVDRYCTKHNITVSEALQHYVVKDAARYYLEIK